MEKRILAQFRNRNPIAQGSSGAVCVSGGGDSVALLRILSALKNRLGLKLEVLHFDHRLRPESAAEAEWVAGLAQELELPCRVRSTDRLERLNSGVQAAASAWRRAESLDALQRHGLDWAATAHHRDDHLETLIMALLRGGHIAHFRGIAAAAPPYVRPLLAVSHEELLAYLRDIGQPWLEDPSNRSPKYLRNRVRHELMPLLLDLTGGGLDRRLMALARQSAEVNELLGSYAHVAQSDPAAPRHWIDADELARLPGIVATEALSQFVQERMPGTLRHDQLESAVRLLAGGGTEWRLHLSHHRGLQRLGSRIILASTAEEGQPPVTVTVDGFRVTVPPDTRLSGGAAGSDEASGEDSLSLYNLAPGAVLNLRRPRQGDRFHPPGRSNSIPLNEYLRARGIPLYERRRLPVAAIADCSGAEQVIGIYPGIAAQHFAIPRDASVRGLCIRIEYWPQ